MNIDDSLKNALDELIKNPNNRTSSQEVIDVENQSSDGKTHQVVTLYLKDKYAVFHGEYTQTAFFISELRSLVDYCTHNGWDTNLT